MRETALVESRPEVGSSRRRRVGSVSSSLPMFTLFLSPPLTMWMGVSAQPPSRSWQRTDSTSSTFLSLDQEAGRRRRAV